MFLCILEMESFKHLLNVTHVGTMNEYERVHLVYVLQSEFYAKASEEFLGISRTYAQVNP